MKQFLIEKSFTSLAKGKGSLKLSGYDHLLMRYTTFLSSILFAACSKQSEKKDLHLFNSEKTITRLTEATRRFSIAELHQSHLTGNSVSYRFTRLSNPVGLRQALRMEIGAPETFTYSLTDAGLRLNLNGETNITANGQMMLFQGIDLFTEELSLEDQTTAALMVTLYRELTSWDLERAEYVEPDNPAVLRLCRKTAMSIRPTKSSSIDHLNDFVDKYLGSHPKCSRMHGVDSGCLWGDYGCISTQEIQCKC